MDMDIRFENVAYAYQADTPFEMRALYDVNFSIPDGSYTAIIGHTGSGKSTILQHLNALLTPTKGKVIFPEMELSTTSRPQDRKALRKKVGIVFQFPEAQLFEETVEKDIAFGPKNFGVSEEEANQLARQMIVRVGLTEQLLQRSPFELSGGQMRRVAIAGVLAMEPEVLVLDEPTAGLDPKGRMEMMALFKQLHEQFGVTIVLVTHQMEDVADYATHVIVMERGTVADETTPGELFQKSDWLLQKQLGVPESVRFFEKLRQKGWRESTVPLTVEELAEKIVQSSKKGDSHHG